MGGKDSVENDPQGRILLESTTKQFAGLSPTSHPIGVVVASERFPLTSPFRTSREMSSMLRLFAY